MKKLTITEGTYNGKQMRVEQADGNDRCSVFTDGKYNGEFDSTKGAALIARLENKTVEIGTTN